MKALVKLIKDFVTNMQEDSAMKAFFTEALKAEKSLLSGHFKNTKEALVAFKKFQESYHLELKNAEDEGEEISANEKSIKTMVLKFIMITDREGQMKLAKDAKFRLAMNDFVEVLREVGEEATHGQWSLQKIKETIQQDLKYQNHIRVLSAALPFNQVDQIHADHLDKVVNLLKEQVDSKSLSVPRLLQSLAQTSGEMYENEFIRLAEAAEKIS